MKRLSWVPARLRSCSYARIILPFFAFPHNWVLTSYLYGLVRPRFFFCLFDKIFFFAPVIFLLHQFFRKFPTCVWSSFPRFMQELYFFQSLRKKNCLKQPRPMHWVFSSSTVIPLFYMLKHHRELIFTTFQLWCSVFNCISLRTVFKIVQLSNDIQFFRRSTDKTKTTIR